MLKRLICALLVTALVVGTAFAAAPPKKVLSAKDIDNFIVNFEAMNVELQDFGDKYDDLFPKVEGESTSDMITRFRAIALPAEVQAVVKKYGFGDNGFEKIMVITMGYAGLTMDDALAEMQASYADSPDMAQYIDMYKQQIAEFKSVLHADDLKLIKARQTDLMAILGSPMDEQASEDTDYSESDYGYGDYGDYGDEDYSEEEYTTDDEDYSYGD